ncbi:hypothetical protein OB13_02000 [Pontibacter sp. HJ8]
MNLSLIDLSTIPYHGTRTQAFRNTIETAQKVEEWGYQRIWFAEHHNTQHFAGRSPEVMIAAVAAKTSTIRVGSGSVLLNHYSPFKVAEVFGTLQDLYPNRIDLGVGRATTGPISDFALQRNRTYQQTSDDSFDQLAELLSWLHDDFESEHPFSQVKVYNDGLLPNVYLLGSSRWSAQAAAKLGLKYVFAGFINPMKAYDIMQTYQQNFVPSGDPTGVKEPELILSLSVYAAETEETAIELSAPSQLFMQRLLQGDLRSPLLSEKAAVRILQNNSLVQRLTNPKQPPRNMVGAAATIKRELEEIQAVFGFKELMVQLISANHVGRLKSLELLAQTLK